VLSSEWEAVTTNNIAVSVVAFAPSTNCQVALTPQSVAVTNIGATGSVAVTAAAGCGWTVGSSDSWIEITSAAGGTGDGPVTYDVAPNPTAFERQGSITVGDQTFAIVQAATVCNFSLSTSNAVAPFIGATGLVTVAGPSLCSWTAESSDPWISVISDPSGNGNGTVAYAVEENLSPSSRFGRLTIAGQVFTIYQAGAPIALNSSVAQFPLVDGEVNAMVLYGSNLYFGGTFERVAEYVGSGLVFDGLTGRLKRGFPLINDATLAAIPDGAGGFYVGGRFSRVGPYVRHRLARIRADGSVDPDFDPDIGGYQAEVRTLLLDNGILYAGGRFSTVNGGLQRWSLAALDPATGLATAFNPCVGRNVDSPGSVFCLLVTNNTVYVGGAFDRFNKFTAGNTGIVERVFLAAVDKATGLASSWNVNGHVVLDDLNYFGFCLGVYRTEQLLLLPYQLGIFRTDLVVGGYTGVSGLIGGQNRFGGLARIALSNGQVLPWNSSVLGGPPVCGDPDYSVGVNAFRI
jgi:hypothetical protein